MGNRPILSPGGVFVRSPGGVRARAAAPLFNCQLSAGTVQELNQSAFAISVWRPEVATTFQNVNLLVNHSQVTFFNVTVPRAFFISHGWAGLIQGQTSGNTIDYTLASIANVWQEIAPDVYGRFVFTVNPTTAFVTFETRWQPSASPSPFWVLDEVCDLACATPGCDQKRNAGSGGWSLVTSGTTITTEGGTHDLTEDCRFGDHVLATDTDEQAEEYQNCTGGWILKYSEGVRVSLAGLGSIPIRNPGEWTNPTNVNPDPWTKAHHPGHSAGSEDYWIRLHWSGIVGPGNLGSYYVGMLIPVGVIANPANSPVDAQLHFDVLA